MSPEALKAVFSPDSDSSLIVLLTLYGEETIRLADGYTQRISENADEVMYGVVSRGQNYIFLPMNVTLPTEDQESVPRMRIEMHDVTRQLIPVVRTLGEAISVKMEIVLSKTPDVVEASFDGLLMAGVTYNANTITADLTVESLSTEPFPAHSFTPSYFPGLF
jgi:hypothetical protein